MFQPAETVKNENQIIELCKFLSELVMLVFQTVLLSFS